MEHEGPAVPGRLLAVLLGGFLALLAGCLGLGWLLLAGGGRQRPLEDPELRRELLARLAMDANALNDSHPDAEVGRVLAPASRFDYGEVVVRTNRAGMREREVELPKPANRVRVVLLGDSFVFGIKCSEEERLGGRLERYLRDARTDHSRDVEVLSVGVSSWSLVSEIAYVRRQADRLQPDLVVHLTVPNDLADVSGVRGSGVLSSFVPLHPERADAMVGIDFVPLGLGWEGRSRFAMARARVLGFVSDLSRLPASPGYLMVAHWGRLAPVVREEIGRFLDPDSILYTPLAFYQDKSTWLDAENYHWNPAGNERLARVLCGLIQARRLLPALALARNPDLEREAAQFAADGLRDAAEPCEEAEWMRTKLPPRLELGPGAPSARQVHAGIDEDHLASPYVSILLGQPAPASALRILGRALPDTVLADAVVRVWIEEHEVGKITLRPDQPIDFRADVPPLLRGNEPLNVRLEASDHVYRGDDLRHCVVFQLDSVALE
jgi:hypothetical protein